MTAKRGAGGLVTALSGALSAAGGRWIASAHDRRGPPAAPSRGAFEVEAAGADYRLRYLSFDPDDVRPLLQRLDEPGAVVPAPLPVGHAAHARRSARETDAAWDAFVEVNRAFAAAMAEEGDALGGEPAFLVQDYHLSLVPAMLKELRPGARIAHFSHIPFAGPSYLRILPERMRSALLAGPAGRRRGRLPRAGVGRALPAVVPAAGGRAGGPAAAGGRAGAAGTSACASIRSGWTCRRWSRRPTRPDVVEAERRIAELARRREAPAARRPGRAGEEHPARVPGVRPVPRAQRGVARAACGSWRC